MMDGDRLIEAAALPDDPEFDVALRPKTPRGVRRARNG